MDEISNKTLATLLVVAIVISLAGTFSAINGTKKITQNINMVTGHATYDDTGETKINITSTLEITLTNETVDFGAGYRNTTDVNPSDICVVSTDDTAKPSCWYNESAYTTPNDIQVENTGNIPVNVSIKSDTYSASDFWQNCGTGSQPILTNGYNWTWKGELDDSTSKRGCNRTASDLTTQETNFSLTPATLCTNLSPTDNNDLFNVSIKLAIPAGPVGLCNDSITFTAEQNY